MQPQPGALHVQKHTRESTRHVFRERAPEGDVYRLLARSGLCMRQRVLVIGKHDSIPDSGSRSRSISQGVNKGGASSARGWC